MDEKNIYISLHFPLQHRLKITAAIFNSPHCSPIKILNPLVAPHENVFQQGLLSRLPPYPGSSTPWLPWTQRLHILKQPQAHVISEFLSICTSLVLVCQFFLTSVPFTSKHLCASFRNLGAWRGITPQYSQFWRRLNSSCDLKVPNRCGSTHSATPAKVKLRWEE